MTYNNTVKTLTTLVLVIGIHGAEARVVIPLEKQETILQSARSLLGTSSDSADLETVGSKDPFNMVIEEEPEPEIVEVAEVVEVMREMTDSEILALASKQLRPSGFIDQGGQLYLILNGKKVQDGVSFNFPHLKKRYAIEITQIQTNSFTLNLNSESKTISME